MRTKAAGDRSPFSNGKIWAELMTEVAGALPPSARRANLLIRGLSLHRSAKRILRIGSCRIRILGETRPCERMEEAWPRPAGSHVPSLDRWGVW